MPIRFLCEHCHQRLSVGSRKAGAAAKCPKCKQRVSVPESQEEADQFAATVRDEDGEEADDPFAQFTVYDRDDEGMELVYEEPEPDELTEEDTPLARVDPSKVAVPRQILYLQGALLGLVGLLCFGIGVVVGSATSVDQSAAGQPIPCELAGKVTFKAQDGAVLPDEGAVVVILPQDMRPDEKAPVEGLLPDMPLPNDRDPGLRSIHSIGGDYTRADVNGEFRLKVSNTGKYFVLVLSSNAQRSPSEALRPRDLAQLGRFFMPAPELLGQSRYRWEEITLLRDRRWDVAFE